MEEKDWEKMRESLPKGYIWIDHVAERGKRKGRAQGGILVGIRESLGKVSGIEERVEMIGIILEVKVETWKIWTVYWGEEMKKLIRVMDENTEERENEMLVIGGDMNARIGREGTNYIEQEEQEERKSKDGIIIVEGQKLLKLINDKDWYMLNGNVTGDMEGECTYVGARGTTVTDYGILNARGLERTEEFRIGEKIEGDHQPLQLRVKGHWMSRREIECGKTIEREIVDWTEDSIKTYREQSKEGTFEETDVEGNRRDLKEKVEGILMKRKIKRREKKIRYKHWWDGQCIRKKRKIERVYRKWKEGQINRKAFTGKRAEFEQLCREKERGKRNKVWEEVKKAKIEANVWRFMNKGRKEKR